MERLSETGEAAEWSNCGQRAGTMLSNYPNSQTGSPVSVSFGNGSSPVVEKLVSAIQLPRLEAGLVGKRQVGSERGDEFYTVDLARYTCTCHSFRNGRAHFGETDIRRCCRHISRLLLYEKRSGKLSDFLHVLLVHRLNYGRGIWGDIVRHPMRYYQIGGDDVLLVKGESNGVDVFAPKPSSSPGYGIFGYSCSKLGWSDLGMPKHHQCIAELIRQWVLAVSPQTSPSIDAGAASKRQPRIM